MKWTFYQAGDFAEYAQAWDALNHAAGNSPLLHSTFVRAALHAFATGAEKLAVLGELARPAAMCVLVRRNALNWETFQPSQAPIGFWLMRRGLDLQEVLTGLLHDLPSFPLIVGLTQQYPLLIPRPSDSARLLSFDYIETMHIETNVDYEPYWQARGKNLRQNMRTVRNRLEKKGISYQLQCIFDAESVAFAIAEFARMECSGWKGDEGTAVSFEGEQGRFYVDLLQKFCKRGVGRIYYLSFGDAIVAMDLCVEQDGMTIILKTTYDETYSEYSPAMMLHHKMLRLLMQSEQAQCLEFYGRVKDWQLRLTDQSRAMYHVNVYRWGWLKGVMHARIAPSKIERRLKIRQ